MKSILLPAASIVLAFGLPAIAQDRARGSRAQDGATQDNATRTPRAGDGMARATFGNVDEDNSSWISLREAEAALGFDAGRFRTFDTDRDGRIGVEEFKSFLQHEVLAGRSAPSVGAADFSRPPRRRNALQLRLAFDRDLDGVLDKEEFIQLAIAYGFSTESGAQFFGRADRNGDVSLDVNELELVVPVVDPTRNRGPERGDDIDTGRLFGGDERRERSGHQAPRIVGPVLPFMRLDLDNDGILSSLDIDRLRGRMQVPIALQGALNDIDYNGDGEVTKVEFLHSIDPTVSLADESAKR